MPSAKPITLSEPARRLKLRTPATAGKQTVPPLFLTKKLRKTIEQLLPVAHHERLRQYFDLYGCLHCSQRKVIYGANGFCGTCLSMIGKRIRKIDTQLRARKPAPPPKLEEIYLRSYNCARELLFDLKPRIGKGSIRERPNLKCPSKIYLRF